MRGFIIVQMLKTAIRAILEMVLKSALLVSTSYLSTHPLHSSRSSMCYYLTQRSIWSASRLPKATELRLRRLTI